jgi:hypothetical protein
MPNASTHPPIADIESALAWLTGPPAEDPQVELAALCGQLAATAAAVPALQWHTVLELFQTRTNGLNNALKPQLLEATLPLFHRLRLIAQGLIEAHGALAEGFIRVLREGEPDIFKRLGRNQAILISHAIFHLAEQQEIALLVAAPPPPNLWRQVHAILRMLKDGFLPEATLPPDIIAADRTIKRMLALAASQPESCAAKEVAFLADYLNRFAGVVEIRFSAPATLDGWFWLEEDRDGPPIAAIRRPPPPIGCLLFFSCRLLADTARQQMVRLAKGERPESLGLPDLAATEDYRNVLARAAGRWASPSKRHSHRRRNGYRVQVCPHLETLWRLLGGEAGSEADHEGSPITDWMVLNEAGGGFAMMHVAGDVSGIVSGAAVGMRTGADPWRLCLIRWARSDNPEHVELGLELIAPAAQAVKIVWPTRNGQRNPVPALLMPSLPRLDRGEALMAPRGHYRDGHFTLITEADGKFQLTECVAGDLAVQTATVDVFEFGRDFSPLSTG